MEVTTLHPTDLEISRVGFGCAGLMRVTSRKARMRLLAAALDAGISHFDVARMYGLGAAEREVGHFLRGKRAQVTIATKFGIGLPPAVGRLASLQRPARSLINRYPALRRTIRQGASRAQVAHQHDVATARSSLETSLRELGTDYVDLFLLHEPASLNSSALEDLCGYLESARNAGKIRAWGFAGDQSICAALQAAVAVPTAVQFHKDIFSSPIISKPDHPASTIVFGVISSALPRIRSYVIRDPVRRRTWTEALGFDATDGTALASLLLRDAVAREPHDVVLFSTTHPTRVAPTVLPAVAALSSTADDSALATFRGLLSTDPPPPIAA
jgi:D-threo-aldose 1-dehydrogenase